MIDDIKIGNKLGYQQVGAVGTGALADAAKFNAPLAGCKGVDNFGVALDGLKFGARVRISRRVQGATDSAPGLDNSPSDDTLRAMAANQVSYYIHNTSAEEHAALTHIEPWNEIRPNTDGGYTALAKLMIFTCQVAEANNFKIVALSLNAGTPEWSQIIAALKAQVNGETLMTRLNRGGHRIGVHEGLLPPYPDILDASILGCSIPGSPFLKDAHPLVMRWLFWRLAAQQLGQTLAPVDVTEFYPLIKATNDYAPLEVVTRIAFYEGLMSKYPEAGIVFPYGVGQSGVGLPRNDMTKVWPGLVSYATTITGRVNGQPAPNPNPVPIPPPAPSACAVGLHWRADGRGALADTVVARIAKIEAVKLMSTAGSDDIDNLRALNPNMLFVTRLFDDFSNRGITPDQFVQDTQGDMATHYAHGVRLFEIHNEPNLIGEGWRRSWADGAEFSAWFIQVAARLKTLYANIQVGWPGLSPGPGAPQVPVRELDQQFLSEAGTLAPSLADFVCQHIYWQSLAEMRTAPDQLAVYQKWSGNRPIYVTEFADVSRSNSKTDKGNAYVEFYRLLDGRAKAAFAFVVSASDPQFALDTWRDEMNNQTPIPVIVGARAATPPAGVTHRVNTAALNVREFPWSGTVEPPLVGQLKRDDLVKVEGMYKSGSMFNGWACITPNGNRWVNASYLSPI